MDHRTPAENADMPEPENIRRDKIEVTGPWSLAAYAIKTYGAQILGLVMMVTIFQVMMIPIMNQKATEAERMQKLVEELQKTSDATKVALSQAEMSTRLLENLLTRLAVKDDNAND